MDKICVSCRAFKIDDGDDIGSCQLHPPIAVSDCFMFPGVHPHAWCLDWQPKERERAETPMPLAALSDFDQFWAAYPKKKKVNDARKAWKTTAKERPPLPKVLAALPAAHASLDWTKEDGQFIPYPASWLRAGQWADVPTETKPSVFEEFLARGDVGMVEEDL